MATQSRPKHVNRTLTILRDKGFKADITQRWVMNPKVPGGGFRKDLFGIVDLLILDPDRGFVGVQVCGADFSSHLKSMTSEKAQEAKDWLNTPGGFLELWGWRKIKKKRGGKALIWVPRIQEITKEDLQ